MPKVVCAYTECKYNNEKHRCTAKEIAMSWHSVMTVHDGRQEFLKCKNFAMDDESRELAEKIMEFMLAKRNE